MLLLLFWISLPVNNWATSKGSFSTPNHSNRATAPAQQTITEDSVINVPAEISNLQDAIKQVPAGGTIELSSGTYDNGGKYFIISNLHKGFTIRAASGATVTLTGKNTHDVFRYLNNNIYNGEMVYFENLTFADGYSNTDGVAGGMIMRYAKASFFNCIFQNNNGNQPSTGGGGIVVADQSLAFFTNTKWLDNRAKFYGAGLDVAEGSTVTLIDAEFRNNRTNYAGHSPYASGGGIHVGNSNLYVFHSYFEDNQAGYVGGAIYAAGIYRDPVDVPRTVVRIENSTFINNRARKDPSVEQNSPTEAGAVHAENQTWLTINNCIFITNSADTGGGVNLYRAQADIYNSVFYGNQATGPGAGKAFGGAISVLSNDGVDSSTADGTINRPPARITVRNVYIQGRYGSVSTVGMAAGGIYVSGDKQRQYGMNGVPQMGTASENRVKAVIDNVILYDLDVISNPSNESGTGMGGALVADLADITINNTLVAESEALYGNGMGGGIMILGLSLAIIDDVTIARNKALKYGGGFFSQGAEIHIKNSRFFENEVSPGVNETANQSYGAAMFISVDDGRSLWATGEVRECTISSNIGLPIFDDDRNNNPINETRYNANQFYNTTFWDQVYADSLSGSYYVNASGLNNLVVTRTNGSSTDKSMLNNNQSSNPLIVGDLIAIPPVFYTVNGTPTFYLGYAWSGGSAQLDGQNLSGNAATSTTSTAGVHTLTVSGISYQIVVTMIKPSLFIPLVIR